jgi:excinuclease UvrABC helicase subunit UvrB
MAKVFNLISDIQPTGDRPETIRQLVLLKIR